MHDLLLKNGTLLDPTTNLHRKGDLAVNGSLIAAILDSGAEVEASRVIDVTNLLVRPGRTEGSPGTAGGGVGGTPTAPVG